MKFFLSNCTATTEEKVPLIEGAQTLSLKHDDYHYVRCNNDGFLDTLSGWWSLRYHFQNLSLRGWTLHQSPFFKKQLKIEKYRLYLFIDGVLTVKQLEWVSHQIKRSSRVRSIGILLRGAFTAEEGYRFAKAFSESWFIAVDANIAFDARVHLVKEVGIKVTKDKRLAACLQQSDEDFETFLQVMTHLRLRYLLCNRLYYCHRYIGEQKPLGEARRKLYTAYLNRLNREWNSCKTAGQQLSKGQLGRRSLAFLQTGIDSWDRKFQVTLNKSFNLLAEPHEHLSNPEYLALFFLGIDLAQWQDADNQQRLVKKARNKRALQVHSDKASHHNDGTMTLVNAAHDYLTKDEPLDSWAIEQLKAFKQHSLVSEDALVVDESAIKQHARFLNFYDTRYKEAMQWSEQLDAYKVLMATKSKLKNYYRWLQRYTTDEASRAILLPDYLKERKHQLDHEADLLTEDVNRLVRIYLPDDATVKWVKKARQAVIPDKEAFKSLSQRVAEAMTLLQDYGNTSVRWYSWPLSPFGKTVSGYVKARQLNRDNMMGLNHLSLWERWFGNTSTRILVTHYILLQTSLKNLNHALCAEYNTQHIRTCLDEVYETLAEMEASLTMTHQVDKIMHELLKLFPPVDETLNAEFERKSQAILNNHKSNDAAVESKEEKKEEAEEIMISDDDAAQWKQEKANKPVAVTTIPIPSVIHVNKQDNVLSPVATSPTIQEQQLNVL